MMIMLLRLRFRGIDSLDIQHQIVLSEGLLLCPEGAATVAAYRNSVDSGLVSSSESVVLFNTATGLKYPMPDVTSKIDKNNVEYSVFKTK